MLLQSARLERFGWLALVILGIAGALRFDALFFGLDWHDTRYAVLNAETDERGMVQDELDTFLTGKLVPRSFLFRGTGGYYLFGVADLAFLAPRAARDPRGWKGVRADLHENPSLLHAIQRVLSALAGVLTVLVVMRTARREIGPAVALLAGAMLAVSNLHVRLCHLGTIDVLWGLATMLAVDRAYVLARAPSVRNHVTTGLLAGVSAATKYFGVVLGLHVVTVHLVGRRRARLATGAGPGDAPGTRRLLLALAMCAVGFLLLSTCLVVGWREFLAIARVQRRSIGASPTLSSVAATLWEHLRVSLWIGMGEPVLVLALVGLVVGWLRGGTERLSVAFALLALPALGITNVAPARFATVQLLLLSVPAAVALEALLRRLPGAAGPVVILLVLGPSLVRSTWFDWILNQPDTRPEMLAALDALHVRRSDVLAYGQFGLPRRNHSSDLPYVDLLLAYVHGDHPTLQDVVASPPRFLLHDETSTYLDRWWQEDLAPLVRTRYVERLRIDPRRDPSGPSILDDSGGMTNLMVPFARPWSVLRPGSTLVLYERRDG